LVGAIVIEKRSAGDGRALIVLTPRDSESTLLTMDMRDAMATDELAGAGMTGTSWSYSYWFAFTYRPPASLVGREARMR
jgi:hypothetical protein